MIVLWPSFAILFDEILMFLSKYKIIAIILSSILGPLTYFAGSPLGLIDINNLLIKILSNYYKLDYSDKSSYEKYEIEPDDLKSFSGNYIKRKLLSSAKIEIIAKDNNTLRIRVFGNGIDEMEFGMHAISKNKFSSEILGIEVIFDVENSNLIAILGDGEEHKFKKRKK